MAFKGYRTYCSTLLLIIIACQSTYSASATTRKLWGLKHKGTLKTIETDDGEVIDCVDIYKQPALENRPTNYLKMSPTSYPVGIEMNFNTEVQQNWQKYGECPEGTIPIRRSSSSINQTKSPSFTMIQNKSNHSNRVPTLDGTLEYAMASKVGSYFYGAYAWLNIWNPKVENDEFSASKILLSSEFDTSYNSIEAGWIVYPSRYKDNRTRLYIYWRGDGHQKTGCYDLDCNGFIQTSRIYSIGSVLEPPISSYGGDQYGIGISIFQDKSTGDWWLRYKNSNIGYWPSNLFTTLKKHATAVNWGGEILNRRSKGHHTTTQMGSGHLSAEGFSKSSLISYMTVVNFNHVLKDPGFLDSTMTRQGCYDLKISKNVGQTGHIMYFGGPGFSSICT